MSQLLTCMVVDDEPLAREGLERYVHKVPFLELKGQAENAFEAMDILQQTSIELIFLDIQMPELTGIDLVKSLHTKPMVVFTTAYPSYALQGYELDVLDYLVKPISFQRFLQAAQKAQAYRTLTLQAQQSSLQHEADIIPPYVFIKCEHKLERIQLSDILFLESMQNYVAVYTPHKRFITLATLKSLIAQLPSSLIMQVHKSYAVSISQVEAMEGNELTIHSYRVPVGRLYKEEVLRRIISGRLLGK